MAGLMIGCDRPARLLSTHATRIVALAPSVTETIFALGSGSEVVGVSQYCDYPPVVRQLPKVGTFLTPNIEEIVALRATLVIGLSSSSDLREVRALNEMGIGLLMVDEDSVEDIAKSIQQIGDRVGQPRNARDLAARLRAHIRVIEQRLAGASRPRVLMLVGHQPLVAVGRGTYLDELLWLAHADNIARNSAQAWPRLSLEYIIASRPEVILDGQMGTDPHAPETFWARNQSIPAVRNNRVYGYPDDPTLHPGPRVPQTLELLARLIHPEAFVPGYFPREALGHD
jgi:iron complex transport system substrate-binding protein